MSFCSVAGRGRVTRVAYAFGATRRLVVTCGFLESQTEEGKAVPRRRAACRKWGDCQEAQGGASITLKTRSRPAAARNLVLQCAELLTRKPLRLCSSEQQEQAFVTGKGQCVQRDLVMASRLLGGFVAGFKCVRAKVALRNLQRQACLHRSLARITLAGWCFHVAWRLQTRWAALHKMVLHFTKPGPCRRQGKEVEVPCRQSKSRGEICNLIHEHGNQAVGRQ